MFSDALENEDTSKFREIKKELEIHMMGEEKYFYPKAKKADKELVQHGIEEHEEAKGLIKEINRMGQNDNQFMPKLKELKNAVEHHIEEEEGKLFPKTQKKLEDSEEDKIASQIEQEKTKMM